MSRSLLAKLTLKINYRSAEVSDCFSFELDFQILSVEEALSLPQPFITVLPYEKKAPSRSMYGVHPDHDQDDNQVSLTTHSEGN